MSSQPRDWCSPRESFGRLDATERMWSPPKSARDAVAVSKFRAAVMQNVIVLAVREHKNLHGVPQEELARRDPRTGSLKMWNARLCGRANLTTQDIATLMMVLPDAMPSEATVRRFIEVAEGSEAPPSFGATPTRAPLDPESRGGPVCSARVYRRGARRAGRALGLAWASRYRNVRRAFYPPKFGGSDFAVSDRTGADFGVYFALHLASTLMS